MTTKNKTLLAEITPDGISRLRVLSFLASMVLSAHLLNAIAAFRALTIQSITSNNSLRSNVKSAVEFNPITNPIAANGNANKV